MRSEIMRQAELLDAGGKIKQETRHFQETTGSTRSGRSKEEATDYRYFPEPDLVPLAPDADWVERICARRCRSCRPPVGPVAERARPRARTSCRQLVNAGVVDRFADTVAPAPGRPRRATGGWATWRSWPTPARWRPAAADHAGPGGPGDRADRGRHAVDRARPAGGGRRAGDRCGRRRGGGRSRPRPGVGHLRADRGRAGRDRCQSRGGRQGPRWQGRRPSGCWSAR